MKNKLFLLAFAIVVSSYVSRSIVLASSYNSGVQPLYYEEYLGRATEREYLPIGVLYDPYGDKSYQKIRTTATLSVTFVMKGGAAGFVAQGSFGSSLQFLEEYSSSVSTNPADMGPGKGDRIICNVYYLTWDVWFVWSGSGVQYYKYKLVSAQFDGTAVLSRSDLKTVTDAWVEDKTGTTGSYRRFWDISANTPVNHEITYSWSGSISVGYEFKVNILGIPNAEISYTFTFSGTQSYSVYAHYEDSQKRLRFYENADRAQNNNLDNVYSYVLWYSQA